MEDKRKQTVVIVDDSAVNLKAGKVILKNYYNVFAVPSAEKLFELLENMPTNPDLILLDVVMPGMNGHEVIKKLKAEEKTRDIPVIFLSALDDTADELEGLNLGAIDYIAKPFSAPLLLKRIESHLIITSQTREMKNINEELLHAKEEAESANRAKSTFLAHMSHEIRTPMNAISGLIDIMREDNLDASQKGYLETIKSISKTLLQIINDILDLSKIEAGKMDILPVHFRLRDTYDQICSAYKVLVMNKDLQFRSSLDTKLPEVLYGDEIRIRQIITNIVGNAIKYTHQGFVELKIGSVVKNDAEWLTVAVEDSGIGIKEEDYKNVFSPFEKLDLDKNRHIQGTGLGLPITLKFAEMMGGTIELKSVYGKGSVFTIYLPLVPGDPEKTEKEIPYEHIAVKGPLSVLVVDDNPVNLTVALGFLRNFGIYAESAASGAEALRMINEKACEKTGIANGNGVYDLVFMDHMMPEMDGLETTRRIREQEKKTAQNKPVPIIALSANAVSGAEKIFFDAGMNDFIFKPINAAQLNRVLGKWLPPEKIESGGTAMQAADISGDPVLQSVSCIDGLDCKSGLSNAGQNKESYLLALRQFEEGCDSRIEELSAALRTDAWRDYAIRAHGLKGVFAALGADQLSLWAAKLEKAANNNTVGDFSPETCLGETPPFCKALIDFRDKLRSALASQQSAVPKSEKPKGDKNLLEGQFALLRSACAEGSTAGAEKSAAWFNGYEWDDDISAELELINRFIVLYDYDKVIERIDTKGNSLWQTKR